VKEMHSIKIPPIEEGMTSDIEVEVMKECFLARSLNIFGNCLKSFESPNKSHIFPFN